MTATVHLLGLLDQAVANLADTLPGVVRIRWNLGPDWEGTECLYFRIVVENWMAEISPDTGSMKLRSIESVIRESLCDLTPLFCHFNYRTVSEMKQKPFSKEKEWL